ncbi:MAG TPA: flagellar assembly protein FliW [Candidatus Limnocylindrales bacterium]|jgi:flagellar assembly factor FliW
MSHSVSAAAIVFPDGLVGLPDLVRHRLSAVPDSALYELTSDDDPTMGFIAASADSVKPGTTDLLRERGLVNEGEWVLAILAVHGEPPGVTANLAGPLVIDMEKATARQLVVEDPDFPLRVPVAEPV